MNESDQLANKLGELLLGDVLERNGFTPSSKRPLTPEQKQQIRTVLESLQVETERFLQHSQRTHSQGVQAQ